MVGPRRRGDLAVDRDRGAAPDGGGAGGELWAFERAGVEGPGWKPLKVAFWTTLVGASAAVEALTDVSMLFVWGVAGVFTQAVDQIARGIQAERDGAPRPVRHPATDEEPGSDRDGTRGTRPSERPPAEEPSAAPTPPAG